MKARIIVEPKKIIRNFARRANHWDGRDNIVILFRVWKLKAKSLLSKKLFHQNFNDNPVIYAEL